MFERFTDRARRTLVLAQEEARLLNHNFIGTEHLLLGMLGEDQGVAATALATLGVTLPAVREKIAESVGPAGTLSESPPFSPRAKKVLEHSLREALHLGHSYIGTEHMLLGLVREGEGVGARVLIALDAPLARVRDTVIGLLAGTHSIERNAVGPEGVRPSSRTINPADLLTVGDIEAALERTPQIEASSESAEIDGVDYRIVSFAPMMFPSVTVAVVDGTVSREGFDQHTAALAARDANWAQPVDGIGDAATCNPRFGALRFLAGSVAVVITVKQHNDPIGLATALARVVVSRLDTRDP